MSETGNTPTRVVDLETGTVDQLHPGWGAGIDTVVNNFVNGEDLIDLSRQYPGITGFDQLAIAATDDGQGVVIDLSGHGGGLLILNGISIGDLDAGDFVFTTPDGGTTPLPGVELVGTDASEGLHGGGGDDTITGGGGDDDLSGGHGRDVFIFDPGHGNDRIRDFDVASDKIDLSAFSGISGFGDLTITTYAADDTPGARSPGGVMIDLTAFGGGTIRLDGVERQEVEHMFDEMFVFHTPVVTGTDGADALEGDRGANTILGLGGDDTLTGGEGADTFVFAPGHGNDTITDFTHGEDLIDLSAFGGSGGLHFAQDGDNAVIDLSEMGGGTITLRNFDVDDLDMNDFLFYEAPPEGG